MRNKLLLMLLIVMVSGCSGGNDDRKPTNAEQSMKGEWVPLHKTAPVQNGPTSPSTP